MENLPGKVAVVTGAASGIGFAISKALLDRSMKVVMADIEQKALEKAISGLGAPSEQVLPVVCDVSKPGDVDDLARKCLDYFGQVHVVCNNAGVVTGGPSWEQTLEDWQWVLGVNLWGVINGIRTFTPILVDQGFGHIVNTASMAGLVALPMSAPYTVSKHAVVGLSEALYLELELISSKVGVSVLCPGWVKTSLKDADRNRPNTSNQDTQINDSGPPGTQSEGTGSFEVQARGLMESLIDNGMDPAQVAGLVVDAIETGKFWIHTHDEMKPAISGRFARCVAEENPRLSLEGLIPN